MPLPTSDPINKTKIDVRRIIKRIEAIPTIYPDIMSGEAVSELLGLAKKMNKVLESQDATTTHSN